MAKYPLQYCKAAFLGARPKRGRPLRVFNGTATFLELPSGIYAITCAHVVDAYLVELNASKDALFQIGLSEICIEEQLVCKNDVVDLATIRLKPEQVCAFSKEGEIGSQVIKPVAWPPRAVQPGEPLLFGGFPGTCREQIAFDELEFGSFSSSGIKVAYTQPDRISCQLEREYWVRSLPIRDSDRSIDLRALGGLSGGPAFVDRGLHFEFAGIIYQHSEAYDIMYLRPAGLIREDGTIGDSL